MLTCYEVYCVGSAAYLHLVSIQFKATHLTLQRKTVWSDVIVIEKCIIQFLNPYKIRVVLLKAMLLNQLFNPKIDTELLLIACKHFSV